MKDKKFRIFFLFVIFAVPAIGQLSEELINRTGISFAKETGIFLMTHIEEKKFGKPYYAFSRTYFMDNNLRLNNRKYLRTGFLFHKFERYCKKNGIYYNKTELQLFRKKSLIAAFVGGLYFTCYVPIILYGVYLSPANTCPQCYYADIPAKVLLFLPVAEAVISAQIRGKAEKRLRENLFLHTDSLLIVQ